MPELLTLTETLAEVEETIGRLETTMVQLAARLGDEDDLAPEARALRWHLNEVAARLRAARGACPGALEWSERLAAGRA